MNPQTQPTFAHSAKMCGVVAIFFSVTYFAANFFAAQRMPLPEIAFAWERHIPFIASSIVPYCALNILCGWAIFLCRSHAEQRHLLRQILAAQCVAVACFVLFPLQMSWQKPPTSGFSGSLFATVALLDAPYNQAPSLHIILAMIVGAFYWRRFQAAWARKLTVIGFTLIGVSVLTTWQHHLIDVILGIFAASWIMWWLPEQPHFAPKWQRPPPFRQTRYAAMYVVGAMVFLVLANGFSWWLLWGAWSCLLMALAYGTFGAISLQKQANGKHTLPVRIGLLPFHLLGGELAQFWTRHHRHNFIAPNVAIGSIFGEPPCAAVLDLCAEYPYPHAAAHYVALAWLDLLPPSANDLRHAAQLVQNLQAAHGSVLLCCALGYERSAAVAVTWLVQYGGAANVAAAYAWVYQCRPQVRLSAETLQQIALACAERDFQAA